MASQFFGGLFSQTTSQACITDLTPPTFAGIVSAIANTDGSITVSWALATSPKPPVDYHIYIALGSVSAGTLFDDANVAVHIPPGKTSGKVFLMPDETTYLVKDQVYTLGVRSNDALSFEDSNIAIQVVTAIASGNFPAVFQSLIDQFDSENDTLAASNTDLAAQVALLTTQVALMTVENNTFAASNIELSDQIDRLEAANTVLEGEIDELNASNLTLENNIDDLETQIDRLTGIIDAAKLIGGYVMVNRSGRFTQEINSVNYSMDLVTPETIP